MGSGELPERERNVLVVIFWIGFCILVGVFIGLSDEHQKEIDTSTAVPSSPNPGVPMLYSFSKEEWIEIYDSPRANINNRSNKAINNEDEIQEYLEDHVDGYLEDTYWGEEYDLDTGDN